MRVHVLLIQAADKGHSGVSGVERGHVGRTGFEPPRLIRKVEVARIEAHRIDAPEPPRQGGCTIGVRWRAGVQKRHTRQTQQVLHCAGDEVVTLQRIDVQGNYAGGLVGIDKDAGSNLMRRRGDIGHW